ncbi:glycosyltransferase [Methylovirgula sp. 4M-Z18]|nr:glycosyltransferase [Methylovirgula sp. 4M-Z18]
MARALIEALTRAGHTVTLVSRLRSFHKVPDAAAYVVLDTAARRECQRIADAWREGATPNLWLTYHPYYKAPDLLGPELAQAFAIPYVTAEASYAKKRESGDWAKWQKPVGLALRQATLNLCFTRPDYLGLAQFLGSEQGLAYFPPFLDTSAFMPQRQPRAHDAGQSVQLICVAMMRPGVKLESYAFLACALGHLMHLPWHLTIVGDGPARPQVEAAFSALPAETYSFRGALDSARVREALHAADLFVWPGFGEAYGIAYLEAQAAGLPVVALNEGGIASVLKPNETGILVQEKTPAAYAGAVEALIKDETGRAVMGRAAAAFLHRERSLVSAAQRLDRLLHDALQRYQAEAKTHD